MKTSKTRKEPRYTDTFIREVRANYQQTASMFFTIKGPNDVADFVRSVLTDNSREHCVALYLDGAHQVVSYSIISIGTANMSVVHPREVFQRAILAGAVSIIIAHNHPSGVLTPSDEDHKVTKRLKDAGEILGIKLLDHLIVTDAVILVVVRRALLSPQCVKFENTFKSF
ncbi:MAG TPA: JAB domain-containing protein [Planctomycetaceae bacterium]|jgi:DNA repair protein RadC|nr:JAB domain-containing protein [Planctomycetaceae bacterium]HQZ63848.1 JAB domain-containing protein [Planctomycetaceae bacterium]HRA86543.1 JAB domain-containing protein [Planctomycetaceae bacterium]